jgi:hypothetical protein
VCTDDHMHNIIMVNVGLRVVAIGERRDDNVYLNRDFLVVVERNDS